MNNPPEAPSWQPPANYQIVESALPGITVYAPVAEAAAIEAPTTYACPKCGATTRYDVAAGGVACEHCGHVAAARSQTVGRQAEEFEFTLETLNRAVQGWGRERQEIHCDACGAVISVEPGQLSVVCSFCASNRVNVRAASADQIRPLFLIPFQIQPDSVKSRAGEWLKKGWFHPDELATAAVLNQFRGIYLPFWTFDSRITANWKAEVGYEETERYYDSGAKEWRTRTRINWRWEDGEVGLNIDDLLISGSSHLSRLILERLYPYELSALTTYQSDYLAGWQAHCYDVALPQAWESGKTAMRERARQACYEDIPTSHVRNFSMMADFSDESWRYILLPVYLASYRFEDKVFQVMMNGQTGVVAGQKPVAWWKIWLAIAAMFAPGMLLGLIGLPLLALGGAGSIFLLLGLVLVIIAGVLSYKLYQQAVASEAS